MAFGWFDAPIEASTRPESMAEIEMAPDKPDSSAAPFPTDTLILSDKSYALTVTSPAF